jgi:hypothetical protein
MKMFPKDARSHMNEFQKLLVWTIFADFFKTQFAAAFRNPFMWHLLAFRNLP